MIHFSPELGWWSFLVFWYVFINLWLCIGFSVVVIVGGLFDLRFLLASLDAEPIDETDDGRVSDPGSTTEAHAAPTH